MNGKQNSEVGARLGGDDGVTAESLFHVHDETYSQLQTMQLVGCDNMEP